MVIDFKKELNKLLLESYVEFELVSSPNNLTKITQQHPRSSKWPKFSKQIIKSSPFCTICHDKQYLQVHHIKPFRYFPELELVVENCMVMCRIHHYAIGHGGISWSGYNPNVIEDSKVLEKSLRDDYVLLS